MVGVPRSTGCNLCVRRRVKCDEARPGCGNCAKYGAACPGYDKALKFVSGKHQVRQHQQHQQSRRVRQQTNGQSIFLVSRNGAQPEKTRPAPQTPAPEELRHAVGPPLTAALTESRPMFISTIIEDLRGVAQSDELRVFAPWFASIPEHLGAKVQLDSAMLAFVLHLLGKARTDDWLIQESRSLYGQSLVALQKALMHPVEWKSSETLCATMILSMFELFAGTTTPDSWMKHASGVSKLMQQRGPEAHTTSWDRAMLFSFRAIIIMNSLFTGQECFLAKKNWQRVLKNLWTQDKPYIVSLEVDAVIDTYFANLARVPNIVKHGIILRDAKRHDMPIDEAMVKMLVQETAKLHHDVEAWYIRYIAIAKPPIEIPSNDPGSIYDTVLSYFDVWQGSLYMSYWATMLILQECLNQCQYPIDYTETNREYVRNIFKSVETVAVGMLGPYRVGYSVRIAYDFADIRTQTWVTTLLEKFSRHYAATSPKSYPKPGPNEYQYS